MFKIANEVLKSKSILSCEVVYTKDKYVAHVEFLPGSSNQEQTLSAAKKRCEKKYGNAVSGKLLFRIHSSSESFKLKIKNIFMFFPLLLFAVMQMLSVQISKY